MDVFDAIEKRRSIRKYKDEEVSLDDMVRVIEAGRLAPSWKNGQCWRYIVVGDKALRKKLGVLVNNNPDVTAYENASYILVLCADPEESGYHNDQHYYLTDAGICMEQSVLAATALGLGTCWLGIFDEKAVKEALKIPDNIRVVALSPLGVPDQEPKARPRKPTSEIAYANYWGETL